MPPMDVANRKCITNCLNKEIGSSSSKTPLFSQKQKIIVTFFLPILRKRQLISPEELKLPWRPLYDLGQRIFDKNALHVGMFHYIR